jgi:ribosomal protein S18 acetylase RimI-like enzyme
VKVTIRNAAGKEAGTVADIGRRTFYETWKSVNTEEDLQLYMTKAFDIRKIAKEIEDEKVNTFLLAFVNDELAGYAKLRNDRSYDQLKGAKSFEVERIYVLKKFQGKHVGKVLMDESIRLAHEGNYEWIWLGVNDQNFKAIEFYKKYGFEVFGTKQFVLGTAIDEDFLMKRKVKSDPPAQ